MKTTRKTSESGHEPGEVKSRRKVGCFISYFIPKMYFLNPSVCFRSYLIVIVYLFLL